MTFSDMCEYYKNILIKKLSNYRYIHTLAVADKAYDLAKKQGLDCEKAYISGLIHDIMKDANRTEQLQIMNQFGIILSDVEKISPRCWHAMAGEVYAKHILNIQDCDILSAIRYHTTARKDMTLFEKILYLADFTSEDRDYDRVENMRKAVDIGIDFAMKKALAFTISELANQEAPIHPDSIDAYNQTLLI